MKINRLRYTITHIAPMLLVALLLLRCGGSESAEGTSDKPSPTGKYATTAPMSSRYIKAEDVNIAVLQPEGWQPTADPEKAPGVSLWFVKNDYSASISFTRVQMDPALYTTLRKDGLSAVAKVSLGMKKEKSSGKIEVLRGPELYQINKRTFGDYEYKVEGKDAVVRVVLFDTGKEFVECALLIAAPAVTPADNRRLIEVQESILASMVAE